MKICISTLKRCFLFLHHITLVQITMLHQAFSSPCTEVLLRLLNVSLVVTGWSSFTKSLRTAVISSMPSKNWEITQCNNPLWTCYVKLLFHTHSLFYNRNSYYFLPLLTQSLWRLQHSCKYYTTEMCKITALQSFGFGTWRYCTSTTSLFPQYIWEVSKTFCRSTQQMPGEPLDQMITGQINFSEVQPYGKGTTL